MGLDYRWKLWQVSVSFKCRAAVEMPRLWPWLKVKKFRIRIEIRTILILA